MKTATHIGVDINHKLQPNKIAQPINVKALEKYAIFVEYSDGVKGRVNLAHLAHQGVFHAWDHGDLFGQVRISENGAIVWNDDIDICPDNVYLKIKGLTFEEWQQQNRSGHATNQ